MKCAYYQKKKKTKMSDKSKRLLQRITDDLIRKTVLADIPQTFEIIREECEWPKEELK